MVLGPQRAHNCVLAHMYTHTHAPLCHQKEMVALPPTKYMNLEDVSLPTDVWFCMHLFFKRWLQLKTLVKSKVWRHILLHSGLQLIAFRPNLALWICCLVTSLSPPEQMNGSRRRLHEDRNRATFPRERVQNFASLLRVVRFCTSFCPWVVITKCGQVSYAKSNWDMYLAATPDFVF